MTKVQNSSFEIVKISKVNGASIAPVRKVVSIETLAEWTEKNRERNERRIDALKRLQLAKEKLQVQLTNFDIESKVRVELAISRAIVREQRAELKTLKSEEKKKIETGIYQAGIDPYKVFPKRTVEAKPIEITPTGDGCDATC
jgi:hypothetical protein